MDCGAKMTIQGTVAARACLHCKASVADALQVSTYNMFSIIESVQ